jgi:hypothetical protein
MANEPPSNEGLNAMGCMHFLLIRVHPEQHRFGAGVGSTEGMSKEGP